MKKMRDDLAGSRAGEFRAVVPRAATPQAAASAASTSRRVGDKPHVGVQRGLPPWCRNVEAPLAGALGGVAGGSCVLGMGGEDPGGTGVLGMGGEDPGALGMHAGNTCGQDARALGMGAEDTGGSCALGGDVGTGDGCRGHPRRKNVPPAMCHITYQLQYRTCGKDACSVCRKGGSHGPYWYAYWREQQGMRSAYVGKVAPPPCSCPRCLH